MLALGKQHGYDRLRGAVETALSLACWDVAAVQYLLSTAASAHLTGPWFYEPQKELVLRQNLGI